jgi:hypothetical protein
MKEAALGQFKKFASASQQDGRAFKRRVIVVVVALATMAIYFAPFVLLGSKSYFTVHDNLDDEFVVNYLLVKTGKALVFDGATPFDNIMNGLPRASLPSGLNVSVLLFYIFNPAWAYIVNFIFVHVIAFCGMFLLLRKHFLTKDDDYLLAGAISICFFLVPYYTIYGLSVAGQPLLAYAFLNIRSERGNWKDYLVILFFPLWSTLALIAPFAVTALGLILTTDWVRSRRLNKQFFISISLFASVYVALQYQLINSILGTHTWVSHRSTWNRWTDFNVFSNIKRALEILFITQYHTGSFSSWPVVIAIAGSLALLFARKRRAGLVDVLAIAIGIICLEYGFYDWLARWLGWLVRGSQAFNASRYYFLLPLLWMLVFALSLKELKRGKWGLALTWCLIAIQAAAILQFDIEYKNNVRILIGKHVYDPSFDRFFAQDVFSDIDRFIGRPKNSYRVVSIGMYPSVAEFNGFYTLDGYLNNYSLSYKLQFRQIIWKELNKDADLKEYFDGWGNRCYVFSSELGHNDMYSGDSHFTLHNLDLDVNQMRAMGGEYVISAVRIQNNAQIGLRLEREFFRPDSFWHVYLYYVLPETSNHVTQVNQGQNMDSRLQLHSEQ